MRRPAFLSPWSRSQVIYKSIARPSLALALSLVSALGPTSWAQPNATDAVSSNAPAPELVALTNDQEADLFADRLFNLVLSTDPTKKTVFSFLHFAEEGRALNPRLARALETVERRLYVIGQSHRLVIEREVVAKADLESTIETKLQNMDPFSEVHFRAKYRETLGVEAPEEAVASAAQLADPRRVRTSIGNALQNLFGIRGGLTLRAHYSYPVSLAPGAERNPRSDHTMAARFKLAFITSALAVTSFSFSVAGPLGFLEPFGSTHLQSASVLGAWVFACLYNFDRLQLFKGQGRSLEVDRDGKVALGTNRLTYATTTVIQEIVGNGLITAALMGVPALWGSDWKTVWGVFILLNGAVSGLSYIPVEAKSAALSLRSAGLLSEAKAARQQGRTDEATALTEEGQKLAKRSKQLTFVWWNIIYPIFVKWAPVAVMMGMSNQDASEAAKWVISSSVGLAFVAMYFIQNGMDVAGRMRDQLTLAMNPELQPCETHFVVRQIGPGTTSAH